MVESPEAEELPPITEPVSILPFTLEEEGP